MQCRELYFVKLMPLFDETYQNFNLAVNHRYKDKSMKLN